jgi:hypothetical protein
VDSVPYPMSTPEDLAQTVKEVEALDPADHRHRGRRPRLRRAEAGARQRRGGAGTAGHRLGQRRDR